MKFRASYGYRFHVAYKSDLKNGKNGKNWGIKSMRNYTNFTAMFLLFWGQATFTSTFAESLPHCLSQDGNELPIDNNSVLNLEHTTQNQYKTQSHVAGVVSDVYPDHSGHQHFAIKFNGNEGQIEVIYNTVFGSLPAIRIGMPIEACGEYITSNAATSQYPASSNGAIIHWVHINPNQGKDSHPSGFLVVNNTLCGQDATHAGHGHGGHPPQN